MDKSTELRINQKVSAAKEYIDKHYTEKKVKSATDYDVIDRYVSRYASSVLKNKAWGC